MNLDSLRNLLIHELQDLYSAEKQLLRALPKMERAASDDQLKGAIRSHIKETRQQAQRLEHMFSKLDVTPGGHRCKAMAGLLREAKAVIKERGEAEVLDAGLIGAAQRVEHYEIAAYGTARAFAKKLGEQAIVELLTESLEEEGNADKELTRLAEERINLEALEAGHQEPQATSQRA